MGVTVQYYPAKGGSPIVRNHTVATNSRGTIHVNSEGLPKGTYSARVQLSEPGLVERSMYLKDSTGATGSADVVGVVAPQQDWYFAEGFAASTFHERYILSAPHASGIAHATVTFFLSSGKPVTQNVTLAPGQQHIINANVALGSNNVYNGAHVHADVPILAERFISFTYTGSVGTGQHASIPGASDVLGAPAPSHVFYFAEGSSGGQFGEYLTIENPNPTQTAHVMVTFLSATSGVRPTVRFYQVAASRRFTLFTNGVMPKQAFSMAVASDIPIVAERTLYFNFNNGQTGGSAVVGYSGFVPPAASPPPPNGLSVYSGTWDGKVYAMNANDGSVRWTYQTGGIISTAPAVAHGVLYVGSQDEYLYAINTSDGSLRWRFKTGAAVRSSPTVADGIVYFGSDDGTFYALNADTGATVWSFLDGARIEMTAAVANGIVYFGSFSGGIIALDANTGAPVWTYRLGGVRLNSQLLVVNNILYANDGFGIGEFDPSTGALLKTLGSLNISVGTPALVNGVLYMGDSFHQVDAADPTSGTILWSYQTGSTVESTPAVQNEVVYIGSDDTNFYALNASDGSLLWHAQTGGLISYASPTVANGVVFIASEDGGVYAFNTSDGSLLWRTMTTNEINSSPVVAP